MLRRQRLRTDGISDEPAPIELNPGLLPWQAVGPRCQVAMEHPSAQGPRVGVEIAVARDQLAVDLLVQHVEVLGPGDPGPNTSTPITIMPLPTTLVCDS